jgi:hypothetical protein
MDGKGHESSESATTWGPARVVPTGRKQWHGTTATTAMTHIATQARLEGKTVDGPEGVSNEQHRAGRPAEWKRRNDE